NEVDVSCQGTQGVPTAFAGAPSAEADWLVDPFPLHAAANRRIEPPNVRILANGRPAPPPSVVEYFTRRCVGRRRARGGRSRLEGEELLHRQHGYWSATPRSTRGAPFRSGCQRRRSDPRPS